MTERAKRILLVDDDAEVLESVQLILEEQGYEVIVARDGTEAMTRVERDHPDLVVLDVVMPRRSGFTVLHRIRQNRRSAPRVVMLTGNDEQQYRDFAADRGADAFLGKPFDLDELVATVQSLIGDGNVSG